MLEKKIFDLRKSSSITLRLTMKCINYILICGTVSPLLAEDLSETVISASRTEELLKDTPYSVSIIGKDELLERSVRTLPEAFKDVPGVLIQKTTHAQGSPFIRGFTGRQNLLLVDGVRINNSTFRSCLLYTSPSPRD